MSVYRRIAVRFWPVALAITAMCAIQGGASLATTLFAAAGPAGAVALRQIAAAVILLVVLRPWRRGSIRAVWKTLVVYGLALGVMNLCLYQAIARIPLGIAVALEFTGPLLVALVSSRRALDVLWIALAVAGLAVLLWPTPDAAPVTAAGAAFALAAGGCWALYILFGRRAGATHGLASTAWGVSIAALAIAPIGVWQAGAALLQPQVLVIGAAVAVLSTALPYSLEMIALPRLPTQNFGTLMSLEPAIGALFGLAFLGQLLGLWQWLAVAAIVVASIGTTLTPARAARRAPARRAADARG